MGIPFLNKFIGKNPFSPSDCQYGFDRHGRIYRLFKVTPASATAGLAEIIRLNDGRKDKSMHSGILLSPSLSTDDDSAVREYSAGFSMVCSFSRLIILDFTSVRPDPILVKDFISGVAAERICFDENNLVIADLPDFYSENDLDIVIDTIRMCNIDGVVCSSLKIMEHVRSITESRVAIYAGIGEYAPEMALKMLAEGAKGIRCKATKGGNLKIKKLRSKCLKELKSE